LDFTASPPRKAGSPRGETQRATEHTPSEVMEPGGSLLGYGGTSGTDLANTDMMDVDNDRPMTAGHAMIPTTIYNAQTYAKDDQPSPCPSPSQNDFSQVNQILACKERGALLKKGRREYEKRYAEHARRTARTTGDRERNLTRAPPAYPDILSFRAKGKREWSARMAKIRQLTALREKERTRNLPDAVDRRPKTPPRMFARMTVGGRQRARDLAHVVGGPPETPPEPFSGSRQDAPLIQESTHTGGSSTQASSPQQVPQRTPSPSASPPPQTQPTRKSIRKDREIAGSAATSTQASGGKKPSKKKRKTGVRRKEDETGGREKETTEIASNKRTSNNDTVNMSIIKRPRRDENLDPSTSSKSARQSNNNALIVFEDEDRPRIICDLTVVDLKDMRQEDDEDEVRKHDLFDTVEYHIF
jgi:hypothetical protein